MKTSIISRQKFLRVSASLFLAGALLFILSPHLRGQSHQKANGLPEWTLIFTNSKGKKVKLYVEVAATEKNRRLGLMHRDHLKSDHGMIFVFEKLHHLSFWMKNTKIPLSVAYADKKRVIREIYPLEPHNERGVRSKKKLLFAIEANRGWFQKNHIGPGSKFEVDIQSH